MDCCGGGGHGSHGGGKTGEQIEPPRINWWLVIGAIAVIALFVFSYLR